jgi:acetyl-CoA decarbonylase/synthase complex subunit delta
MSIDIPKQDYSGSVKPITLGSGERAVTVGGDTAFPFYTFEGEMSNPPQIAIQVVDYAPDDWADACVEPYKDVLADPVAWALA